MDYEAQYADNAARQFVGQGVINGSSLSGAASIPKGRSPGLTLNGAAESASKLAALSTELVTRLVGPQPETQLLTSNVPEQMQPSLAETAERIGRNLHKIEANLQRAIEAL